MYMHTHVPIDLEIFGGINFRQLKFSQLNIFDKRHSHSIIERGKFYPVKFSTFAMTIEHFLTIYIRYITLYTVHVHACTK